MTESSAGVTVVVPTLNRGPYLINTVRDLLAQTHRPLEVLVVDQSATAQSGLDELVAAGPDIISHYRVNFRGLPNARNFGWQHARHDLIVYVDDDIRCGPRLISGYAEALRRGACIVGSGIDGEDDPYRGRAGVYSSWICASRGGFRSRDCRVVDHVRGCSFGVRREVFSVVGGFDEQLAVGSALHEETEFMLRASASGYPTRFCGEIRVTHLAVRSGGTRQTDPAQYVSAFMHNRTILIRRYSDWYQWPTCLLRSTKITLAHAWASHDVGMIRAGIRGTLAGWRDGGRPPQVTRWQSGHASSPDHLPAR